MKYFGTKLKELRIKCGLTQKQLAKKLNISPSSVGMYEQGRREPDFKLLGKICSIFSTCANDFVQNEKTFYELKDIIKLVVDLLESSEILINNVLIEGKSRNKVIFFLKEGLISLTNEVYKSYVKNN